MSRFDRLVIFRSAAYGLLIGIPATLANSALSGDDGSSDGLLALSFVAVLLAFLVAGIAAGRQAATEPTRHGAVAGLVAYVPVELLAILGRVDRGAPIRVAGIVLLALLGAWIGSLGALLGARRRAARTVASGPAPGPEPTREPQEGP